MTIQIALTFLYVFIGGIQSYAQHIYKEKDILMGCSFEFTVVAEDEISASHYIDMARSEIKRIEKIISSWDSSSETSLINKNAGIQPTKVSDELFNLIERAIKISKLTNGAFDISYASMDKIWKFDGSMKEMPSPELVKESIAHIDFTNIELDNEKKTVYLRNKGMRIGFGGIGKGYAADKAKELLMKNGVTAGIINASGDLNTWGTQPDGKEWMVAIINPLNKSKVFSWLPVKNGAVVTSGDYENYVTFNGQRYSHIIDPRTGYPSKGILSVTIFTSSAEIADALATSIFVMGVDTGLDLINQLKGIECIIVDADNKIITSKNIDLDQTNQYSLK